MQIDEPSPRKTGFSVNRSCLTVPLATYRKPDFQGTSLRDRLKSGEKWRTDALEEFLALRALQDHRVWLNFSDGQVVIATLVSITSDLDASRHVVYDNVEWSALPLPQSEGAWYAAGEHLVSCVAYSSKTKP
jgi:hypothetical protein